MYKILEEEETGGSRAVVLVDSPEFEFAFESSSDRFIVSVRRSAEMKIH